MIHIKHRRQLFIIAAEDLGKTSKIKTYKREKTKNVPDWGLLVGLHGKKQC